MLALAKESGVSAGGFVQAPREAAGARLIKLEPAEVEIKSNGSSLSGACASCAPSESGPMEKKIICD